jgi:uncharacterized protein YaeQ
MLDEIRYDFRVTLADLARGVEAHGRIVPLHPRDETLERFYLRVLTWALFWTPDLQIAAPTHDPDAPSLYADDPTGRKAVWIAVDPESADSIGHALRHNRGATIAVAFSDRAALDRFLATTRGVKGLETAEFLLVDEELLHAMASGLDERRYDLAITVVEDHLYLQAGRRSFDGVFTRRRGPPPLPA